jgi:hypothetical protein
LQVELRNDKHCALGFIPTSTHEDLLFMNVFGYLTSHRWLVRDMLLNHLIPLRTEDFGRSRLEMSQRYKCSLYMIGREPTCADFSLDRTNFFGVQMGSRKGLSKLEN